MVPAPALGVALFGLAYAGLPPARPALALAPWFMAAGIAIGCVETVEHAAVAALAPVELRGSAFGLLDVEHQPTDLVLAGER